MDKAQIIEAINDAINKRRKIKFKTFHFAILFLLYIEKALPQAVLFLVYTKAMCATQGVSHIALIL